MSTHALVRLRERYNQTLNYADLDRISELVRRGEGRRLTNPDKLERPDSGLYLIEYGGVRIKAIIDMATKNVITVLPLKGKSKTAREKRRVYRDGKKHRPG